MKGIILAGGLGTRLRPLTNVANKHLLPVYNQPMIYYPLQTLIDLGCSDILIVSGGEHIGGFAETLARETRANLYYRVQASAGGVAQALRQAKGFVHSSDHIIPVILGDNYFETTPELPDEEMIIVKRVDNPGRFGVYDPKKRLIVEKPAKPTSNLAVTGLYFYKPMTILEYTSCLRPSVRGELEITDVNNYILENGARVVEYADFWSDMGTFDSLMDVAGYVKNRRII